MPSDPKPRPRLRVEVEGDWVSSDADVVVSLSTDDASFFIYLTAKRAKAIADNILDVLEYNEQKKSGYQESVFMALTKRMEERLRDA
jgi:hypothetical protein